jgi:hypothetical protein
MAFAFALTVENRFRISFEIMYTINEMTLKYKRTQSCYNRVVLDVRYNADCLFVYCHQTVWTKKIKKKQITLFPFPYG